MDEPVNFTGKNWSNRHIDSLWKAHEDGICVVNADAVILKTNAEFDRVLGFSPDELSGTAFNELVHDQARVRELTAAYGIHFFKRANEKNIEFELTSKDGASVPVRFRAQLIHDDQGRVVEAIGFVTDLGAVRSDKDIKGEVLQVPAPLYDMLSSIGDAVVIGDGNGRITFANQALTDMLGYTETELSEKHLIELSPYDGDFLTVGGKAVRLGEDYLNFQAEKGNELFEKDKVTYEAYYLRKDGRIVPVETTCSIQKDPSGNFAGSITICRDISSRRQTLEALTQAKEQIETLIATSLDPIIYCDGSGTIIKANQAFLKMVGCTEPETVGRPIYSFGVTEPGTFESTAGEPVLIGDEYFQENIAMIEKLFEQGRISNWVSYFTRKDGRVVQIDQAIVILKDSDGLPVASFGIMRDVTAQLQEQKEIRRNRDFMEFMLRMTPDIIMTTDETGNITSVNEAVHTLLGFSPEELMGEHASVMAPDDLDAQEQNNRVIFELLENGFVRNAELIWKKKAEGACVLESNSTLLKDEEGNITGTLAVLRDITNRKKIEQQLQQSQKMEAVGTLAGGIAHDFNNILTAIIGYTELSRDECLEGSVLEGNLKSIMEASLRARDLVRQILVYSRKDKEELTVMQLSPLIQETVKLLRASTPTTIEIQQSVHGNLNVYANPAQIHQVLINLCVNATQAMVKQGGVLKIKLGEITFSENTYIQDFILDPGRYACLTVEDTGPGIDPVLADRIFDPFFSTKEVGQGTGMGLAVVHGIVHGGGGAVQVESRPGQGTRFTVYLPAVDEVAIDPTQAPKSLPGGDERILLVDDEKLLLKVGQRVLRSLGYRVLVKQSPAKALEVFRENPEGFDLVITDQTMPQMTGFQLAKEILKIRADIPVMLCTGFSETVSPEDAKTAGIKEYVHKPMERRTVAETVRRILDEPSD